MFPLVFVCGYTTNNLIPFPKILALCERKPLHLGFELGSQCIFPTMIITSRWAPPVNWFYI